MPDTGWIAAVGATVDPDGQITWANPGNITASDNVYTTCNLAAATVSHTLKIDFGITSAVLPATAVPLGIEFSLEAKGNVNLGVQDNSIMAYKAGTRTGDEKATYTWSNVDTLLAYGAINDMWGLGAMTPADFYSGFFIGVSVARVAGTVLAGADQALIRITYTTAFAAYRMMFARR